ncbi:cell division protein FtsK, partial [Micromonospora zamorensis]
LSLARQHAPGDARFQLVSLVTVADPVADDTEAVLRAAGHPVHRLDAAGLRDRVTTLAAEPTGREYLVVFGMDAAAPVFGAADPGTFRSGLDDLRTLLRQGPGQGVHLLGWWRGLRRLADDLGGTQNRDDVACLVALNVPGAELALHLGTHDLTYTPRADRALLIDRHDQRTRLIVPFVGDGHDPDGER